MSEFGLGFVVGAAFSLLVVAVAGWAALKDLKRMQRVEPGRPRK